MTDKHFKEQKYDTYKCLYCGYRNKQVEAQGIWHCPNALCTGPGAAYFRSTLKSYKEVPRGHTVDEWEYWIKGAIHNLKNRIFKFRKPIRKSLNNKDNGR